MKAKLLTLGLACLLILMVSVAISSIDLGSIKVDVVRVEEDYDYNWIKVKITNTSDKHINLCKLSCILYKGKKEVDIETRYVINPLEDGLGPDKFTFSEYGFKISRKSWDKVGFHIRKIDYK